MFASADTTHRTLEEDAAPRDRRSATKWVCGVWCVLAHAAGLDACYTRVSATKLVLYRDDQWWSMPMAVPVDFKFGPGDFNINFVG